MLKSSLIILTRNEIDGVKNLLGKIPFEAVDEYLAVDYNSTDGTVEFFEKNKIPVVKQVLPGRAEAFYLAAKKARGEYLIFFSPDGNEDPADIPKLIGLLDQGCDLAIASRFLRGAKNEEDDQTFKFRLWANKFFTILANFFWHGRLTDSINGYRAIRKDIFQKLKLDATGFAVEYQMTIRALKLGFRICEIPTVEEKRIAGKSGSSAIPTGLSFLYFLARELMIGKRF